MATIDIINASREKVGEVDLDASIFDVEVKPHLMHAAVRKQLAARRQGTHAVKRRSDVRGGGKKPFRQKGTGRARQGTTRAPHMRGGGVVFGPEPRSYDFKINKKELRSALCSALTTRFREGKLIVIDTLDLESPKTKLMASLLSQIESANALLVTPEVEDAVTRSSRNLPSVSYVPAQGLNVYDVLRRETLVMTKDAVEAVSQRLGRK